MSKINKDTLKAAIPIKGFYQDCLGAPHKTNSSDWLYFCPFHNDCNTPNLTVRFAGSFKCFACDAGGGDIIAFHQKKTGCSFPEALAALAQKYAPYLLNGNGSNRGSGKKGYSLKKDQEYIDKVLKETRPCGERISSYLKSRGLSGTEYGSLLLHPALEYWESKKNGKYKSLGKFPTIICKIQKGEKLVGIYRSWLAKIGPGKAPVNPSRKAKRYAQTINGGAIRLLPAQKGKPIFLSEGVETGLAVYEALGWPVWACISAGGVEQVEIPSDVGPVYIAADYDPGSGTGLRSAEKLALRLHQNGHQVFIMIPSDTDGKADWLDILNEQGKEAISEAFNSAIPYKPRPGEEYEGKSEIIAESYPYTGKTTGISYLKDTKNGPVSVFLSNFMARIASQVEKDDGAEVIRQFEMEAVLHGRTYRFPVSANEFSNLAWVVRELGAQAILYPGLSAKEHTRVAIQLFSKV